MVILFLFSFVPKRDGKSKEGSMTRLHQRKLVRFIPEFMHPKKKLFRIHAIQIYPIGLSKKQNQKHVVFGSRFLREAKG